MFDPALLVGGGSALLVALGVGLALRPGPLVRFVERLASHSEAPPEEYPDYYAATRDSRRQAVQFGGAVVATVGAIGCSMAVFGALAFCDGRRRPARAARMVPGRERLADGLKTGFEL